MAIAADEAAQMSTNFEAARHLTRAQNDLSRGILSRDRIGCKQTSNRLSGGRP